MKSFSCDTHNQSFDKELLPPDKLNLLTQKSRMMFLALVHLFTLAVPTRSAGHLFLTDEAMRFQKGKPLNGDVSLLLFDTAFCGWGKVLDISASVFHLRNGGSFFSLEGNYVSKSLTVLEPLDIIKWFIEEGVHKWVLLSD